MPRKKVEVPNKESAAKADPNTTRVQLDKNVVKIAQEAATLLAPQFDMPPQSAIEGVIKFAHEQALKLKEQVSSFERALQQSVQPIPVSEQLPAVDLVPLTYSTEVDFDQSVVEYSNKTDEGRDLEI